MKVHRVDSPLLILLNRSSVRSAIVDVVKNPLRKPPWFGDGNCGPHGFLKPYCEQFSQEFSPVAAKEKLVCNY